jgi:hypothetical protein
MGQGKVCYMCDCGGNGSRKLITCIGNNLCTLLHNGIVERKNNLGETVTELTKIMTDTQKRAALTLCDSGELRAFHPECLKRDAGGAHRVATYTTATNRNKEKTFHHTDQTHRLCAACLARWIQNGGEAGEGR